MRLRSLWIGGLLLVAGIAPGQDLRLVTLGDMRYGLEDRNASLSLYRLGGNPAWLIREETSSWLTFAPRTDSRWGDLRRRFDPGHVSVYGAGFEGVKTLGERGTFRGFSSYTVEERSQVYRSLKRTPYGGEAYFLTDSTTGSFTYKGPAVSFAYAYELLPGLFIGGEAGYALQDGLKDEYTMAKSLYRKVEGTAGIAYAVDEHLAIGITLHPVSEQERLEAKSDDLLDVELFNFRGETFAKRRSSGSISHTVRLAGEEVGAGAHWTPMEGLTAGLAGRIGASRTRDLIKTSTEEEFEDGFAQATWLEVEGRARIRVADRLLFGCGISHADRREWSRYPAMDLLLWDATGKRTAVGGGGTFQVTEEGILLAAEAEFAFVHADSSKYIDNRAASIRTHELRFRGGLELPVPSFGTLRGSYAYASMPVDLVSGGRTVREHVAALGLAVPFGRALTAEAMFRYASRSDAAAVGRHDLTAVLMVRLAEL